MFTKTGLRPRETGVGDRTNASFAGRNLPPVRPRGTIKASHTVLNPSGTATAFARGAQRNTTPKRPSPGDGKSRRGGLRSPSPAGGGAGRVLLKSRAPDAPSGKRKGSAGRTRSDGGPSDSGGRNLSPDLYRRTPRKPVWDNTLGDPSRFRLTPEEMVRRKLSLVSKHNTLVYGQGGGERPRAPTAKQVKPTAGKASDNGRRLSEGDTSVVRRAAKKDVVSPYEISMASNNKGTTKIAGVNSATTSPVPSRGGDGVRKPCGVQSQSAKSDEASRKCDHGERGASGRSNDHGEAEAESTKANFVETLDLAGIKEGIQAFTERVCRLEKDSRAIPEAVTAGEAEFECGPNEEEETNRMRQVGENDGGGGDTTELVERVRLLEAHILRLRFPTAVSPTAAPDLSKDAKAEDFDDAGGVADEAGRSTQGMEGASEEDDKDNEKVASAKVSSIDDDLRVVIADLLSLSALLLKRAANAEERLRKLTPDAQDSAEGESSGETAAVDVSHSEKKPRATAWSVSIASAGSDEVPAEEKDERVEHFSFLSSSSCGDDAVENGSTREIYPAAGDAEGNSSPSPFRGLGVESGSALGLAEPEKASPSGSPAKDYWSEALDAVGQLVEGDDGGSEESVEAFGMRSSKRSSRVEETQRLMPLAPQTHPIASADDVGPATAAPAATLAIVSAFRSVESTEYLEPRAEPRSFPRSAGFSTRRWGAREVLGPVPASALRSDFGNNIISDRGARGFGSYSRASSLGDVRGEEADAGPVVWAPTPSKKPQHPFERLPPTRSPSWLHQNAGNGRGTRVPVASPTVEGIVGRGADEFAGEGCGAQDSAELPAIGQWYTP